MIKCKVTNVFQIRDETLQKYGAIKAVTQKKAGTNSYYKEDIIETTKEMADYLMSGNPLGTSFVEIIEVIPEEKKEKKTTKKKVKNETRKDTAKKD